GIQPTGTEPAGPDRAEQALQPARRQLAQADLRVAELVQRQPRAGLRLVLLQLHLHGVGSGIHYPAELRVAQRAARCTAQLQVAVEYPAQLRIALQPAVEVQTHAPPAHRGNIRLAGLQLQMQAAGRILAEPGAQVLQAQARQAELFRGDRDVRPRRLRQAQAEAEQQEQAQQQMA